MNFSSYQRRAFLVALIVALGAAASVYVLHGWFHQLFKSAAIVDALGAAFVVLAGFVEVSVGGRSICRLGADEVIGEMAYLHPNDAKRSATVVTLEPTLFLEINSAALELGSDELCERFNRVLIATLIDRLRGANQALAKLGQSAVQGYRAGCDLELAPP